MFKNFSISPFFRLILTKDFYLDKEDMRDINYDDVFDTHLKQQGGQFGRDNLEAVCLTKCLATPFREPSNFFYFFALSDTNKSGGWWIFKKISNKKFFVLNNTNRSNSIFSELASKLLMASVFFFHVYV